MERNCYRKRKLFLIETTPQNLVEVHGTNLPKKNSDSSVKHMCWIHRQLYVYIFFISISIIQKVFYNWMNISIPECGIKFPIKFSADFGNGGIKLSIKFNDIDIGYWKRHFWTKSRGMFVFIAASMNFWSIKKIIHFSRTCWTIQPLCYQHHSTQISILTLLWMIQRLRDQKIRNSQSKLFNSLSKLHRITRLARRHNKIQCNKTPIHLHRT